MQKIEYEMYFVASCLNHLTELNQKMLILLEFVKKKMFSF